MAPRAREQARKNDKIEEEASPVLGINFAGMAGVYPEWSGDDCRIAAPASANDEVFADDYPATPEGFLAKSQDASRNIVPKRTPAARSCLSARGAAAAVEAHFGSVFGHLQTVSV
jgi:hypothetical protein